MWTESHKICKLWALNNQVLAPCFRSYRLWLTSQIDISKSIDINQSISINHFYPIEALNFKNGASNSYFVKIETFRMEKSKLLENTRTAHVFEVVCNRFYFGEIQEEVIGQCTGQAISAPRTEGLSAYPWPSLEKKTSWLRKCFCRYTTEVSWFALEIVENLKVIVNVLP